MTHAASTAASWRWGKKTLRMTFCRAARSTLLKRLYESQMSDPES